MKKKKENWLNTKIIIKQNLKREKPCHSCGYCPYGQLVEEFPFSSKKLRCGAYGHDCPMYYHAENIIE